MTEQEPKITHDAANHIGNDSPGLEREVKNVRFLVLQNALYHMDELRFYSFMERLLLFLTTFATAGVFGSLYARHPDLAFISGIVVAALSTASLVFGFSARARTHEGLRQRYYLMLSELEGQRATPELLARINAEMNRTYGDEPPVKWAVSALAWNTARASMTPKSQLKKDDLLPLTRWERMTRFVIPYGPERFKFIQPNNK